MKGLFLVMFISVLNTSFGQDTIQVKSRSDLDQIISHLFTVTNLNLPPSIKKKISKHARSFMFCDKEYHDNYIISINLYFDSCGNIVKCIPEKMDIEENSLQVFAANVAKIIEKSSFEVENIVQFSNFKNYIMAIQFNFYVYPKEKDVDFLQLTSRYIKNITFHIVDKNEFLVFKDFTKCRE